MKCAKDRGNKGQKEVERKSDRERETKNREMGYRETSVARLLI